MKLTSVLLTATVVKSSVWQNNVLVQVGLDNGLMGRLL